MRQIGSLSDETSAERFVDYLTTLRISAQCEVDDGQWLIWIKDENHVEPAREELERFTANPQADQYKNARRQALEIRTEKAEKRIQANKNFHTVRDSWSAPLSKRAPTVFGLIVICIALAVMGGGQVFSGDTAVDRYLMFTENYRSPGEPAFTSIRSGEVWRILTPALLHGNLMHLAFNMYWMYILGAQIEARVGRWRFLRLTLAGAAFPNLLQAFLQGPNFLGISGVVFAYFGYILLRRRDGYQLSQFTIILILAFLALSFSPVPFFPDVAVWAHTGGLAVGAFIGYLPELKNRVGG